VIIDRMSGRRIHASSGRVYHVRHNPPKVENIDDVTGEPLTIRKDDSEEIVRKRLVEYHDLTKPLVKYYQHEAKEGRTQYFRIDGTQAVSAVTNELTKILG